MVSKECSKSMPLYVMISVLTILCSKPTISSATEAYQHVCNDHVVSQSALHIKPTKKSRRGRSLAHVRKLLKKISPKRVLSAVREQFLYSVAYPYLAKYYEIREDGLQRADYFNLIRKVFYLYLAKKCYDEWECRSTLLYLLIGYAGKFGIDWIEKRTDSSQAHKEPKQQNYVNKMLSFLNEEQKHYITNDKELFGGVSVAQDFNDPRLLKENQDFYSLLTSEQTEYLDTIIFEYMSHHNLLKSYLTRRKAACDNVEVESNGLQQLYGASQSYLPWADSIDEQIDYAELEASAAQTDDPDFW